MRQEVSDEVQDFPTRYAKFCKLFNDLTAYSANPFTSEHFVKYLCLLRENARKFEDTEALWDEVVGDATIEDLCRMHRIMPDLKVWAPADFVDNAVQKHGIVIEPVNKWGMPHAEASRPNSETAISYIKRIGRLRMELDRLDSSVLNELWRENIGCLTMDDICDMAENRRRQMANTRDYESRFMEVVKAVASHEMLYDPSTSEYEDTLFKIALIRSCAMELEDTKALWEKHFAGKTMDEICEAVWKRAEKMNAEPPDWV